MSNTGGSNPVPLWYNAGCPQMRAGTADASMEEVGPVATEPTIHEAECGSSLRGEVLYGAEITEQDAVQRRKQGLDIVVHGPDQEANKKLALRIETAVRPAFLEASDKV